MIMTKIAIKFTTMILRKINLALQEMLLGVVCRGVQLRRISTEELTTSFPTDLVCSKDTILLVMILKQKSLKNLADLGAPLRLIVMSLTVSDW